jgi:hypothetical protein
LTILTCLAGGAHAVPAAELIVTDFSTANGEAVAVAPYQTLTIAIVATGADSLSISGWEAACAVGGSPEGSLFVTATRYQPEPSPVDVGEGGEHVVGLGKCVSKAPADTLRLLELDLFATEDFVDGYVQIGPVLNAAIPDSMSITLCGAELCAVGRSFLVRLTNYVEESAQGGVQASFEPSSYSSDYGILYVSGNRIAPPYRFYVGWEQATVNGIAMPIQRPGTPSQNHEGDVPEDLTPSGQAIMAAERSFYQSYGQHFDWSAARDAFLQELGRHPSVSSIEPGSGSDVSVRLDGQMLPMIVQLPTRESLEMDPEEHLRRRREVLATLASDSRVKLIATALQRGQYVFVGAGYVSTMPEADAVVLIEAAARSKLSGDYAQDPRIRDLRSPSQLK